MQETYSAAYFILCPFTFTAIVPHCYILIMVTKAANELKLYIIKSHLKQQNPPKKHIIKTFKTSIKNVKTTTTTNSKNTGQEGGIIVTLEFSNMRIGLKGGSELVCWMLMSQ